MNVKNRIRSVAFATGVLAALGFGVSSLYAAPAAREARWGECSIHAYSESECAYFCGFSYSWDASRGCCNCRP